MFIMFLTNMIKKIKIEVIKNEDKVSKAGKPYSSCSIKTIGSEGQDVWLHGFGNSTTKGWVKGQEVELDVYSEEYNGVNHWKFRDVPERSVFTELDKIVAKLDELIANLHPEEPAKQDNVTVEEVDKYFGTK